VTLTQIDQQKIDSRLMLPRLPRRGTHWGERVLANCLLAAQIFASSVCGDWPPEPDQALECVYRLQTNADHRIEVSNLLSTKIHEAHGTNNANICSPRDTADPGCWDRTGRTLGVKEVVRNVESIAFDVDRPPTHGPNKHDKVCRARAKRAKRAKMAATRAASLTRLR
jgi:hypothetical protein